MVVRIMYLHYVVDFIVVALYNCNFTIKKHLMFLEFISRQTYCQLWWLIIQKAFMQFWAHLFYIGTWILIIFWGKQEGIEEPPTDSIFCLYNNKKSYVHADLGQQKEKNKKTVQKDKTELQKRGNPISNKRFLSGLGLYNIQLHFIAKRHLPTSQRTLQPIKDNFISMGYIVQSVITIISLKIGHCILDQRNSILSSTVASKSHLMPAKHQAPKGHLKNKFSSVSSTIWCSNHNLRS